jgi:hypothetical protein
VLFRDKNEATPLSGTLQTDCGCGRPVDVIAPSHRPRNHRLSDAKSEYDKRRTMTSMLASDACDALLAMRRLCRQSSRPQSAACRPPLLRQSRCSLWELESSHSPVAVCSESLQGHLHTPESPASRVAVEHSRPPVESAFTRIDDASQSSCSMPDLGAKTRLTCARVQPESSRSPAEVQRDPRWSPVDIQLKSPRLAVVLSLSEHH